MSAIGSSHRRWHEVEYFGARLANEVSAAAFKRNHDRSHLFDITESSGPCIEISVFMMQPTTALKMFQPTRRMMIPVPVSLVTQKATLDALQTLTITSLQKEEHSGTLG